MLRTLPETESKDNLIEFIKRKSDDPKHLTDYLKHQNSVEALIKKDSKLLNESGVGPRSEKDVIEILGSGITGMETTTYDVAGKGIIEYNEIKDDEDHINNHMVLNKIHMYHMK